MGGQDGTHLLHSLASYSAELLVVIVSLQVCDLDCSDGGSRSTLCNQCATTSNLPCTWPICSSATPRIFSYCSVKLQPASGHLLGGLC